MRNKYKLFYISILFLFNNYLALSQINNGEKRIYIIDLTASMQGQGKVKSLDVFEKVKDNLRETVSQIQNKSTEITFITFTDKVHEVKKFTLYDKQAIITYIDGLKVLKGDTNIVDAWKRGVKEINSTKINYLFLLTDGLHNSGPDDEKLTQMFKDWAVLSKGTHNFAFYVMLTKEAKDKEIEKAIQNSSQIWIVESLNINATVLSVSQNLKVNVNASKNVKLTFKNNKVNGLSEPAYFKLKYNKNPYYKIKNIQNNLSKNSSISFEIEELIGLIHLPIEVDLEIELESDKSKNALLFFTPNKLRLKVVNQGVRKMYFKAK